MNITVKTKRYSSSAKRKKRSFLEINVVKEERIYNFPNTPDIEDAEEQQAITAFGTPQPGEYSDCAEGRTSASDTEIPDFFSYDENSECPGDRRSLLINLKV